MDTFTDSSSGGETAGEDGVPLVRVAMERAAEGAPPLPDLVPAAVAQGRSRRTRARAAVGAGVSAVVALGVFGATLPLWGADEGGAARPARSWSAAARAAEATPPSATEATPPTATEAPRAVRPPVHVEPGPGESSMADLPAAERARQESFQQKVARLLDELLPRGLGTVHPVDLAVSRYQTAEDGSTFPVVLSVRRRGDGDEGPEAPPCRDNPAKGFQCKQAMLPGGLKARAVTAVGNSRGSQTITGVDVTFDYRDSAVRLAVTGDDTTMVSAPVTADQLLAVAADARFLELVAYADSRPMEEKDGAIRGG